MSLGRWSEDRANGTVRSHAFFSADHVCKSVMCANLRDGFDQFWRDPVFGWISTSQAVQCDLVSGST